MTEQDFKDKSIFTWLNIGIYRRPYRLAEVLRIKDAVMEGLIDPQ